jgi:hypothetical protein
MSNASPLGFGASQRDTLHRLGVIDAQIAELEAVLPLCRVMLSGLTPLRDVRDELDALTAAMKSAQTRMSGLLKASDLRPASLEAWNRILAASFDAGGDGRELERAANALQTAREAVLRARQVLPREQRRSNAASPWPVAWIHQALIRGWGRAYVQIREGEGHAWPQPEAIPPFTLPCPPAPQAPSAKL